MDRESLSSFHGKLKRKYKTGSVISAVSSLIKTSIKRGELKAKTASSWVTKNRDLLPVKAQVLTSLESYKLQTRKDFMGQLRPGAAALIEALEGRAHAAGCMVPRFLYSILGSGICTNDALLEDPQGTAVWVAGRSLRRKIYAAAARLSGVEKVGTFGVTECGIVVNGSPSGSKLPVLTVNADPAFPTDGFATYPGAKGLFYSFYGSLGERGKGEGDTITMLDAVLLSVGCVRHAYQDLPVSALKSLVYQAYILMTVGDDEGEKEKKKEEEGKQERAVVVAVPKKPAELFIRNVHAASLFVYFMELAACVDGLCGFPLGAALVHSRYFSGSLFHHFATTENRTVPEYIKDKSMIENLDKMILKYIN